MCKRCSKSAKYSVTDLNNHPCAHVEGVSLLTVQVRPRVFCPLQEPVWTLTNLLVENTAVKQIILLDTPDQKLGVLQLETSNSQRKPETHHPILQTAREGAVPHVNIADDDQVHMEQKYTHNHQRNVSHSDRWQEAVPIHGH